MNKVTTTKFKGDIVSNDGEKDLLVSDLVTVEEVNPALGQCVTNDKLDTYDKIWINTEPIEPIDLNPNYVYDDSHVMTSKAVKNMISSTKLNLKYNGSIEMSFKRDPLIIHEKENCYYTIDGNFPEGSDIYITAKYVDADEQESNIDTVFENYSTDDIYIIYRH